MILVRIVPDVFDRASHIEIETPLVPGQQIVRYIPEKYRDGYRVALNDRDLNEAETAVMTARDGDLILVVNGDVIGWYLPILITLQVILANPIFQFIVISAVLAGISYGIQALLVKTPGGNEADSVNNFAIIQPTVQNGATIPVIYGRHRASGQLIDYHTEIDEKGDERGYFLFAVSHGRIHALSAEQGGDAGELDDVDRDHAACATIEIDGNSITEYDGITVSFRAGEITQSVIPGFRRSSATRAVGLELDQLEDANGDGLGGPGTERSYTTDDAVDSVVLKFLFPNGFYAVNNDTGEIKDEQCYVNVKYRKPGGPWTYLVSTGSWDDDAKVTISSVPGRALRFERRSSGPTNVDLPISFPDRDVYEIVANRNNVQWDASWDGSGWTYVEKPSTANRHHPPNKNNLIEWEATEQIINEKLAHPGLALIGVKALASDQLNGQVPRITWEVDGVRVRVWDGVDPESPTFRWEWTNNPAWVALDILTHETRGLGAWIPMSMVDLVSFKAWADFCDETVSDGQGGNHKRCLFDGIFDNQQDGWKSFLDVCATARATAMLWGDKIAIKVEKSRSRVQVFGDGNIVRGSFSRTFFARDDQPNGVVVQYRNAANDYEPDAISIESDRVTQNLAPLRSKTMQLPGVVREAQAHREANFALLMLENVPDAVEFQCGLDALVSEPGDVIGVARNIPTWGQSGRVLGGSANTITLEEPVTIGSAPTEIMLARSDGTIEWNQVYFASTAPGDYAAGDTITVLNNWTGRHPQVGDTWALGELNQSVRDYVIQEITTTPELTRKIRAYRYPGNAALAAADGMVELEIDYPPTGPRPDAFPPDVTQIKARESYQVDVDGHRTAAVEVFWQWGTGYASTPAACIYARKKGGGRWRQVGLTFNTNFKITQDVRVGDHYVIAVISLSAMQRGKKPKDAPHATIYVTGRGVTTHVPSGIKPTATSGGIGIGWNSMPLDEDNRPVNRSVSYLQIRRGGDWRTAFNVAATQSDGAVIPDYYPGQDSILVRTVDRSGNISAKAGVVAPLVELDDTSRLQHRQDEREAGWPGVKTLCEVDAQGGLKLTSGVPVGIYVSNVVDLGSVKSWDIAIAQSVVQRQVYSTTAMKKIAIGAINGPAGAFETSEGIQGYTSGALGACVAKRYDGDAELFYVPLSGTFVSGETLVGLVSTSRAVAGGSPADVTFEDDVATGIIDLGGPADENHLTSSGGVRTRIVLAHSTDNLVFTEIDDFARSTIRCRYVRVDVYLATSDPDYWQPYAERFELCVLDPAGNVTLARVAAA